MLYLCLHCRSNWRLPKILHLESSSWNYDYIMIFTPCCICNFNITMVFLNQITGRRPTNSRIAHDIIKYMDKCYQYFKEGPDIILRGLNIILLNDFPTLFILYLSIDVIVLTYFYLKSNNKICHYKNVPMFPKESK